MTYGVTSTGFVRPSLQDILADTERDQRAFVSQNLDQSAESPLGQINGITARQLGMAWEALETAYNAFDVDKAEDFLLTALGKLTGTWRGAATKSVVLCTVNLNAGTTLIAGTHFARVVGKPNIRFTPRENVVAAVSGNIANVVFEAETPGPIEVASATLTVIATAVIGWNSVTNPNPATPGTVEEQDPEFRTKLDEQIATAGNQTFAAIRSDLLALRHEGAQWMNSVVIFENALEVIDGETRPPHTFEVLISDDTALRPPDYDDQIAQVIWDNKPAGIRPYGFGGASGNAIDDLGVTRFVSFSRASQISIYVSLTLTTVPGFTAQAAVKDAIVLGGAATFKDAGTDVIALYLRSLAFSVPGVIDVPVFTLGVTPSPAGTGNIAIGLRQVAAFAVARIVIT